MSDQSISRQNEILSSLDDILHRDVRHLISSYDSMNIKDIIDFIKGEFKAEVYIYDNTITKDIVIPEQWYKLEDHYPDIWGEIHENLINNDFDRRMKGNCVLCKCSCVQPVNSHVNFHCEYNYIQYLDFTMMLNFVHCDVNYVYNDINYNKIKYACYIINKPIDYKIDNELDNLIQNTVVNKVIEGCSYKSVNGSEYNEYGNIHIKIYIEILYCDVVINVSFGSAENAVRLYEKNNLIVIESHKYDDLNNKISKLIGAAELIEILTIFVCKCSAFYKLNQSDKNFLLYTLNKLFIIF